MIKTENKRSSKEKKGKRVNNRPVANEKKRKECE
jgi:hypothetical protein